MAGGAAVAGMAGMKRELTIAGGGLAGLSVAIGLARRGVPVRVLEAGTYPRHRVCGEFISGVRPSTWEALGIEDLVAEARRHRRVRWCAQGRPFFEGELPEAALGCSRYELDDRLRKRLLEVGGQLLTGQRVVAEAREGLLWAAGRRRVSGEGRWVGLKVHARVDSVMAADLEMRVGTTGYTGMARVEADWVNVCGLFRVPRGEERPKARELLPALIEKGGDRELAEALRAAEWREGSSAAVAGFEFGAQSVPPGLAVIGDAESLIPPFTGHGMAMAFQAAEVALEPMMAWAEGRCGWEEAVRELRATLRRRFARRLICARWLHPFLLGRAGHAVLSAGGRWNLMPFRLLYALVR